MKPKRATPPSRYTIGTPAPAEPTRTDVFGGTVCERCGAHVRRSHRPASERMQAHYSYCPWREEVVRWVIQTDLHYTRLREAQGFDPPKFDHEPTREELAGVE